MNVNGARFHLLLGSADWGRCMVATGPVRRRALRRFWHDADGAPLADDAVPPEVAHWDARRHELTLAPLAESIPDTAGEAALVPAQRRACASDAAGNLYLLGDDGASIRVIPRGDQAPQRFWPDARADAPARSGAFTDAQPATPRDRAYVALAVTANGYLVAWWTSAEGDGADRFDLLAGGAPEVFRAHPGMAGVVIDLAPRGECGLWALMADNGGIAALDADLRPCAAAVPQPGADAFQPLDPAAPRRVQPAPWQGDTQPLPAQHAGRQLVLLAPGIPVVLADTPHGSTILALDTRANAWRTLASEAQALHLIAAGLAPVGDGEAQSLFLVPPGGNQAIERIATPGADGLPVLGPTQPHTYPMRRFGGRMLGLLGDRLSYDSGTEPLIVPLLQRRHQSFAEECRFETPVWDSGIEQCLWDRIRIDACLPPGTSILIEARCAEEEAEILRMGEAGWVRQPAPYLNGDNGELPGKGEWALPPGDAKARHGCWDLLLQNQRSRFCQLRITLTGDGRNTPRLRALRLWYPRFSYVDRFLPQLYREEAASADLLDRFLANMEGINTVIEGRIAAAQALFDPRTVPDGMIDWLASWLDLMLDPAWTMPRKRLFLANAVRYFGWRGTVPGLELALRMAFDETLTAADFALGGPACRCPGRIRVVESFSANRHARRFDAPSASLAGGPAFGVLGQSWQPTEGSPGLWRRFAQMGGTAMPGPFPLHSESGLDATIWNATAIAAFGFAPTAGAEERAAWQAFRNASGETPLELPRDHVPGGSDGDSWRAFLALPRQARQLWQGLLRRRYRRIERLNADHATAWADFAEIPVPAELPDRPAAMLDWIGFEGELLPRSRSAHRFSVLLPVRTVSEGGEDLARKMALAQRIVAVEKPAHTEFDVRFYWAMNRVGEARIGEDSEIGAGSRAPELIPPALLGSTYLGSSFVAGPQGAPAGRSRLSC